MPDTLQIRCSSDDDAVTLAELSERTFRDAFAQANNPDEIEAYIERAFSVPRIKLEIEDSVNVFSLAFTETDDHPIDYAKLRASQPDPSLKGPKPIEIERLYVTHDLIGHGVGAALMQTCLDEAARWGYETIWLGVWEANPRAIVFYDRWNSKTLGSHIFMLGSEEQTDLIMERPVVLPA